MGWTQSPEYELLKRMLTRWRSIRGVRFSPDDGPTLSKALDTYGAVAVTEVLDELSARGVAEIQHPLRFFWGCLRHWEMRRRKISANDEATRRRLAETDVLLDDRRRWVTEATCSPREAYQRLAEMLANMATDDTAGR